jgi:hypothetical protein
MKAIACIMGAIACATSIMIASSVLRIAAAHRQSGLVEGETAMGSPTELAAAYMNYAAELLVMAEKAEGEKKSWLIEFAGKWLEAAEKEPGNANKQDTERWPSNE